MTIDDVTMRGILAAIPKMSGPQLQALAGAAARACAVGVGAPVAFEEDDGMSIPEDADGMTPEEERFAKRNSALGFDSIDAVGPGLVVALQASPQAPFKGERLLVGEFAASFRIEDVKVAGVSQLPCAGGVPAVAFSEMAVGPGLDLSTCKPGEAIEVIARNISTERRRFTAAILGKMAPPTRDGWKQV